MNHRLPQLLVAAPLALWLLLGSVALGRLHATPPAGDALVDAVVRRIEAPRWEVALKWQLADTSGLAGSPGQADDSLDAATVKELERDFGDDPRLWLLLYATRTTLLPERSLALRGSGLPDRVWYLQEAQHRGLETPPVLWALEAALDGASFSAARSDLHRSGIPAGPGATIQYQALSFDEVRQIRSQAEQQHWAPLDALLSQLQQLTPGEPLVDYRLGVLAAERGDLAHGLELIKHGSALAAPATDNQSFQLGLLQAAPGPPAGPTRLIRSWSAKHLHREAQLNSEEWRATVGALNAYCLAQGDLPGVQAIVQMILRVGRHNRNVLTQGDIDLLQDCLSKLNPAGQRAVTAAQDVAWRQFLARLGDLTRIRSEYRSHIQGLMSQRQTLSDRLLNFLIGREWEALADDTGLDYRQLQYESLTESDAIWDDLARFDLEHFRWNGPPPDVTASTSADGASAATPTAPPPPAGGS